MDFQLSFSQVLILATSVALCLADSSKPVGHQKPLGSHRSPDIILDEQREPITGSLFFDQYVSREKPVVFRGFAKHWPAFTQWTDETLVKDYGDLELKVEALVEGELAVAIGSKGMARDTVANFFSKPKEYAANTALPSPMFKDVLVNPALNCGELSTSLTEVDLRVSGPTRSSLYREGYNIMSCVLQGQEEWVLINGNETHNVYAEPASRYELGTTSPINVDQVDLITHSRFSGVRYGLAKLAAGDCLFVPGGHYHQVKSTGKKNMAVSVLFGRVDKFNADECKDAPLEAKPLDQFDVLWKWNGTGIMEMGRGDDYFFRTIIMNRMSGQKKKKLDMRGLKRMLAEDMDWEMNANDTEIAKEIMSILDIDKDGSVTPEELNSIERHVFRRLSYLIESDISDLQNTYDFEFAFIDYNTLREAMNELFAGTQSGDKAVDKETFLDIYTSEPVSGSEYKGLLLFAKLDANGDGSIATDEASEEQLEENLAEYEIPYEGDGGRDPDDSGRADGEGEGEEEDSDGEYGPKETSAPGGGENEDLFTRIDRAIEEVGLDGDSKVEGNGDRGNDDDDDDNDDNNDDDDDDDDDDDLELDTDGDQGAAEDQHDEL